MIIERQTEEIQSNQTNLESIKVTVDVTAEDAIANLIDRLSRLYSNPKQTILFEYFQNANDSHTIAKKNGDENSLAYTEDKQVRITLPNKLNPFYLVRDYGIGMDYGEIKNSFSVANKSTKRDSNDYIGGYGVGKLVFSPYCGVMFLTTWKHGEKAIYQFRLKNGEGEITPLCKEKSDEPQGVEIKIPVKESDFEFFQNRAKYSYSFLKTKPIIKGAEVELGYENHLQTEKFTLLTKHINTISSSAMATIGGIPFPITASNIGYGDEYSIIYHTPIVLHFGVGEIDHTPSRDQLEYNDKTVAAINARLGEVKQYLSDYVEEECKKATTLHEARLNFIKFKANNDELTKLINRFKLDNGFKFNGENIKIEFNSTEFDKLGIRSQYSYLKKGKLKTSLCNYTYGETFIVVPHGFSDMKRSKRIKKYLIDNNIKETNVLSGLGLEDGLKELEIPFDYAINIEDLPDPVIVRSYGGSGGSSYRTVKKTKVLELKNNRYPTNVEAWNEIDVDCENDSGVYMLIKYYKPENIDKGDIKMIYLQRIINELRNDDSDFKLLGVRTSEQTKVEANPNMIDFDTYLRRLMDELEDEVKVYKNVTHNLNISLRNDFHYITAEEIDCELLRFIEEEKRRYDQAKDDLLDGSMNAKYRLFEVLCKYFGEQRLKYYPKRNSDKVVDRFEKATRSFKKQYPFYDSVKYQDKEIKNEYFAAMKMFRKNLTQQARSSILSVY